jgi:hypothetical protein
MEGPNIAQEFATKGVSFDVERIWLAVAEFGLRVADFGLQCKLVCIAD